MESNEKDNSKKRIIYCSNFYPPNFVGGAELVAHFHAKTLKDLGHEVAVFAGELNRNKSQYSIFRDIYEGIPVYRINLRPENFSYYNVNFSNKVVEQHFKNLINDFSPNIVHFHHIIGLSVGLIQIAKSRGIKTVISFPDHWGFCFKNTLIKRGTEICNNFNDCASCLPYIQDQNLKNIPIRMRKDFISMQMDEADFFICSSEYLKNAYIRAGFPKEKMRVIWNGIDHKKIVNIGKQKENKKIRFSFVGYFGKHKGVDTLLKALSLIKHKEKIQINLVGDGNEKEKYIQQLKAVNCMHLVHFWGKIDNSKINQVYNETDVLVLPSICPENQPTTIVEAMSSKIPVIASRIGGIPELVDDGKTGFLFSPGSHVELARKMEKFILDPIKIKTFGENGFNKIREATLQNQVKKILEIYNETPIQPLSDPQKKLAVLVGDRVDSHFSAAMESLSEESGYHLKHRFVMSSWLEEEQLKQANVICIMNLKDSAKEINFGRDNKIPFLVPASIQELKELCSLNHGSLYYHNMEEAKQCLKILLNDISISSESKNVMGDFLKENESIIVILNKMLRLQNEQYVVELYKQLLDREPDNEGLRHYVNLLSSGVTKIKIFEMILESKEAMEIYQQPLGPILRNNNSIAHTVRKLFTFNKEQFIINTYMQLLSRKPSLQELALCLSNLTTPKTQEFLKKWQLMSKILKSKEAISRLVQY